MCRTYHKRYHCDSDCPLSSLVRWDQRLRQEIWWTSLYKNSDQTTSCTSIEWDIYQCTQIADAWLQKNYLLYRLGLLFTLFAERTRPSYHLPLFFTSIKAISFRLKMYPLSGLVRHFKKDWYCFIRFADLNVPNRILPLFHGSPYEQPLKWKVAHNALCINISVIIIREILLDVIFNYSVDWYIPRNNGGNTTRDQPPTGTQTKPRNERDEYDRLRLGWLQPIQEIWEDLHPVQNSV